MNQILRIHCLLVMLLMVCMIHSQKTESVHGKYSYVVGENENITLSNVKQKCIIGARNAAIKEKFKEKITSITNIIDANVNGKDVSTFYDEVTMNSCAEWIGDIQVPIITVDYTDDKLVFTAEVWGEAREIKKSMIDLDWKILCNGTTDGHESMTFKHKDRLYIKFKSPVSGYVAIYILDSSSKRVCCMLPYAGNTAGRHEVKAGKEYLFFDRTKDPVATPLSLTTNEEFEIDQVILIFSPNCFTKNNDEGSNNKQLGSQSIENFEQWLKKLRKRDNDMVIDRTKWISIVNKNINKQ